MVLRPVLCPHCHSPQVIKGGKTKAGHPRDKGQTPACPRERFPLDLFYKGRAPALQEPIGALRLQGSGSRDTARELQRSPTTGMHPLKKRAGAPLGALAAPRHVAS